MEEIRQILWNEINFDDFDVSFKQEHPSFKLSIKGIRFRNPILGAALQQSILSNLSNVLNSRIYAEKRKNLYSLFKKSKTKRIAEERFRAELKKIITNLVCEMWNQKLLGEDIPTSVFPTSVSYGEAPNYYISSESYTQETKVILINHVTNLVVGRCGNKFYGLYIPEEPEDAYVLKQWFEEHAQSLYQVNIAGLAHVGKLNLREIGPFEYLFYLLDEPFKEMYRREIIPSFHLELFTSEKRPGGRKISFSHYNIPNLAETHFKLYHGREKYTKTGYSKIKTLVASFLPENWKMELKKEKTIQEAHRYINNFLRCLFVHKSFDLDSLLHLEELKLKSSETSPIWFVDEVISWM